MSNISTILFDFDGVIADTEPLYDVFFEELDKKIDLRIPGFAASLKGKPIVEALNIHYPQFSEELKKRIIDEIKAFELTMDYPFVNGVMNFIYYLKSNGYKVGLVTSSHEMKMDYAMRKLQLNSIFDTEVMAGRINKGKPAPECYLLAARDLGVSPQECVVFEDSLAGLQAGISAGMKVIGVTTTLPKERIKELTSNIINDFTCIDELKKLLSSL